jgi:acetoin utilization protein AcuB
MKPMPDIGQVMTAAPHCVTSIMDLAEAVRIMYAAGIRHLPVVDAGRIVGVLSDRDAKLARAVCVARLENVALTVGDACVSTPYIVDPGERLDRVLEQMVKSHIGSVLVAKNSKLVGIFTSSDACAQLAELLRIQHPDA